MKIAYAEGQPRVFLQSAIRILIFRALTFARRSIILSSHNSDYGKDKGGKILRPFSELEKRLIESMKETLKEKIQAHFEDGTDIFIEPYSQAFYWPCLHYDQKRVYYLLLEALRLATAEVQLEWARDLD